MITVYGVPGWGSTISELMLSLADIPYEVVDVEGFDQPGPASVCGRLIRCARCPP